MRRVAFLLVLPIFWGPPAALLSQTEEDRVDRLTPEHRKWLEEEVVYIILDQEREIFLSLGTVEERNRFIDAFWKQRDPNPATPGNEFKEEHYRRIEYANKFFGRETFREGWRTDRGRMYIILGAPQEIQRFDGYDQLVPQHLWFYAGDTTRGLPPFFYLLFFQPGGIGEFRLYSPFADGPNRLVEGNSGIGANPQGALRVLQEVSPELAHASLSYDTADAVDLQEGRPSLGSETLIARIYDSPKRALRPDYADGFLRFGDRVSAEYSFNYVPSRTYFAVLNGPDGTPFVHYSIELDPGNFNMESDEAQTKFYTTLDMNVEARNKEGVLVVSSNPQSYVEFNAVQFSHARATPISYQSDFPLLPGEYKVSVILKNRVLKRYTVAETELVVPAPTPNQVLLSDLILGYAVENLQKTSAPDEIRTFQVGSTRINPAAGSVFSLGETMHVFLQVRGAVQDSQLHFALLNGDEVVLERKTTMSAYLGDLVIEQFPLLGMMGGRYVMRVRLLDARGQILAEQTAPCEVSPRENISRPSIIRESFNTGVPGLLSLALGGEFVAKRQLEQAKTEFEKAVASGGPTVAEAQRRLAWTLIQTGESARALELLIPLEQDFPNQYEVVAGLGLGYSLQGDCQKGISYLQRAMTLRPPDTSVLNVVGACYMRLGDAQEAAASLERSLTLNPDQPKIKEMLSSIQKDNR